MSHLLSHAGHLVSKGGHLALSSCCYQQFRKCSDNTLADVWIKKPAPSGVKIGTTCYYNGGDAGSCSPGTIYSSGSYTTTTGCGDSACSTGGTGSCASCGISTVKVVLSVSVCTGCYNTCFAFGDGGSVSQQNIRDLSGTWCVGCGTGFTTFTLTRPPYFYSPASYFKWTVTAHNAVNRMLSPQKPQMALADAAKLWRYE